MKKNKSLRFLLASLGILICSFAISYDWIRGKDNNQFGTLQWLVIVLGLLIAILPFILKDRWLNKTYDTTVKLLNKEFSLPARVLSKKWIIDVIAIVFFAVIAIAFFLGRWEGADPVVNLGSDAANVATYAAVQDQPENFANDFYYNDESNISYYVSLHLPYLRLFHTLLGGYGLAYLSLLLPIIFLQQLGFYYFGKKFLKNRFWAFLLAILSLIIVYTSSSDYWGVYKDPQPRMFFGAFFPWLLLAAYSGIQKPKFRIFSMVMAGLMLYVHPVSTPGVAFAIWLGFLLVKPDGKTLRKHIGETVLLGIVFVVMTVPFIISYLGSRDISHSTVDYATAIAAFKAMGMAMFNLGATVLEFLKIISVTLLLPLALIALAVSWAVLGKKTEVKLILFWIIGVLFVSVGVNYVESLIDQKLQILPVMLQLNRGLRYLIPLLEISILIPMADVSNKISGRSVKNWLQKTLLLVAGILLVIVFSWGFKNVTIEILDVKGYAQQTVKCWLQGKPLCKGSSPKGLKKTLEFVTENTTPQDTFISIPPLNVSKVIRYQCLRSISFNLQDAKTFSTTDIAKYLSMSDEIAEWEQIESMQDGQLKFQAFLDFANKSGADYAIASSEDAAEFVDSPYAIVYSTGDYAIIQIP